ncbi:hypothetical protein CERSUDRAFT_110849 [Gelatoporia subvermispora B]|uniref:Uncharacterized protein n=1 Tax=Ceriporiopsis subvermispora (strain B) TaxID=914234 RepID=M2RTP9_CERS8|nr:hypothetical protein CERSUDRAFT_110849 [Gelatoporia subvermispora B]
MGFFSFLYPSQPVEIVAEQDLTTMYPPRDLVRPTQPKAVRRMPLEIVMNVLETAYYNDALEPDVELLTSCALVCKDWSYVSQKLLFRHVTLRSQPAYISFQEAIDRSTPRGRMLGDAVVRMRVVLDQNQPYRLAQRSFARAVTLCPNLYELNVALYGAGAPGQDVVGSPDAARMQRYAPAFDDRTLALLRSGPRISALQLSNWSDNCTSLSQLLDIWPCLKSLVISGIAPQLVHESLGPFPCALEELRMNFQTSPSVDFLQWLLHNSASTLRVLEFERDPSPELLDFLTFEYGSKLQSLALPTCMSHESVRALRACGSLREFKMESGWATQALYKALPSSLEHLAIGIDADTPLQQVVQNIRRCDTLSAVTLHVWHGGERHPQLPALKIACALQGVDLRMTRDIREFRRITRGDPVPAESYPRPRTLDNIRYMQSSTLSASTPI